MHPAIKTVVVGGIHKRDRRVVNFGEPGASIGDACCPEGLVSPAGPVYSPGKREAFQQESAAVTDIAAG